MSGRRVAVLGAGMAGLTTAWELSRGDWRDEFESITVYQRGWRAGGKGASSRGEHDRIEEHGLHVLLGYYDTTFRVLREVYAELDRPRTDPSCPFGTWRDAFTPSSQVGLADRDGDGWSHFVTGFGGNDAQPGEPGAESRPVAPLQIAVRGLQLLTDFHRSMEPARPDGVYLSASPHPRATGAALDLLVRGGALTALAAGLEALDRGAAMAGSLGGAVRGYRDGIRAVVLRDPDARRTWELVDLVATNVLGVLDDGLVDGTGFERIDHLDYREWLAAHGAAPETLDCAIVRGMYDLTFAYEQGDKARPRFSAGLGLQLAARMLFDFKGAIFWRMQAGMGEVVFAPLYEALARRGVEFRFFHRLDRLELGDGAGVRAVHLTEQAGLAGGAGSYQPLVRVDDLPCWPHAPLIGQLDTDPGPDCETHRWEGSGTPRVLRAGQDFDSVVLAVSLGMVPHVADELVRADRRWRAMVDNVATVATRAAQVWLDADERELGWTGPSGVTLSGFGDTFDTWASMTHLLARESWPAPAPRSLAYFCSALPDGAEPVDQTLRRYLDEEVHALWPSFQWDMLHDDAGRAGPQRLQAQYVRANVDPSDRYVQSLPGSGRYRLAPGDTGFSNLVVAGDWTACGLDAGCLEAAARSGVLAARAVRRDRS